MKKLRNADRGVPPITDNTLEFVEPCPNQVTATVGCEDLMKELSTLTKDVDPEVTFCQTYGMTMAPGS